MWLGMSQAYYPTVDLGSLAAFSTIASQLLLHEDYLGAECPYTDDVREQLDKMFAPKVVEREKVVEVEKIIEMKAERAEQSAQGGGAGRKLKVKTSGVDLEGVSGEIQGLRQELQQLKIDSKGLQTSDKIQIIKTRAALVEKLVAMDERTNNLKKTSQFQTTILSILDDLIPEDRRLEFIKRVHPFAMEDAG